MKLEPWTLLLQAINFVVLTWLMKRLLYRPIQEVLSKRHAEAAHVAQETSALVERKESAEKAAQAAREALADELTKLREQRMSEIALEAHSLLASARSQADALTQAHEQTRSAERDAAYRSVRDEALDFGLEAAASLFADLRSDALRRAFWERIESQIDALSQSEREEMRGSGKEASVTLRVYPTPPPEEREQLARKLEAAFSCQRIEVVEDEALIAGVELECPNGVLRASARDALATVRARCIRDG